MVYALSSTLAMIQVLQRNSLRTCPHETQAISKFESTWYPPEFDTILCTYWY